MLKLRLLLVPFFLSCCCFSMNAQGVIGGEEVTQGTYPWMAALVAGNVDQIDEGYFCGGVLIAPGWVLTAAHCLDDLNDRNISSIDAVFGTTELDNPTSFDRVEIAQSIIHPLYVKGNGFQDDLALLRLDQDLSYETIKLPKASDDFLNSPGVPCRVLGWGISDSTLFFSSTLQQADIQVIADSYCNSPDRYNGRVSSDMLCAGFLAGGQEAGAASGDSGGPLMVFYDSKWYQIGVVSWGQEKWTTEQFPGVYQKLSNYYDWIQDVISGTTAIAERGRLDHGIERLYLNDNKLYLTTNPAFQSREAFTIVVSDLLGRSLFQKRIQPPVQPQLEIPITNMHTGTYTISIHTSSTVYSKLVFKN